MGVCAECGAETRFEWVRPAAWKHKIEEVSPHDLICLRCYKRLHWS